jgi:hypothetical protein
MERWLALAENGARFGIWSQPQWLTRLFSSNGFLAWRSPLAHARGYGDDGWMLRAAQHDRNLKADTPLAHARGYGADVAARSDVRRERLRAVSGAATGDDRSSALGLPVMVGSTRSTNEAGVTEIPLAHARGYRADVAARFDVRSARLRAVSGAATGDDRSSALGLPVMVGSTRATNLFNSICHAERSEASIRVLFGLRYADGSFAALRMTRQEGGGTERRDSAIPPYNGPRPARLLRNPDLADRLPGNRLQAGSYIIRIRAHSCPLVVKHSVPIGAPNPNSRTFAFFAVKHSVPIGAPDPNSRTFAFFAVKLRSAAQCLP